jgi:hypothetical protein
MCVDTAESVKGPTELAARAVYRLARALFARDFGIGTSSRPVGPITVHVAAPREIVFDVIAGPYLGRTPRALASKLKVLERDDQTVLAEHYTQTGRILATTLETVRFDRPDRVEFRLLRGPVPHLAERFELREVEGGTELDYSGELRADLWALGRWWGRVVGDRWEAAVRDSLDAIRNEAERRAR